MIAGLSGSLLSHEALTDAIGRTNILDPEAARTRRSLMAWHAGISRELGPSTTARTVFDRVAEPLLTELGFTLVPCHPASGSVLRAVLLAGTTAAAVVVAAPWGREPGEQWRTAVHLGIGRGVRWCLCVNGLSLRVVDTRRTYSRRFTEFDLGATLQSSASFSIFWRLLCAAAFTGAPSPRLDQAVESSEAHRSAVRASLQSGVQRALTSLMDAFAAGARRRRPAAQAVLDDALVVIYRVLFLLFAEARGLVPTWHTLYRRGYTIESLRELVESPRRPDGLWESLQAIARLAHRGCQAGSLRVTPFNGRLFAPAHAPLAEAAALDDGRVRDALLALTTRVDGGARRRISFADLGVEQLGGVYERVLDFDPQWTTIPGSAAASIALVPGNARKAAGAFYTPRFLTEYLVRRTLAPLVRELPAERIMAIRVLDPAMGSGAFLVAACRYLASAYEAALVRDGSAAAADLGDAERAGFRRLVAQRCLFGVDLNPMAVQLGRLSLWLATLSAQHPLTFLDHHLRTGNSLVGATLDDVVRRATGSGRPRPGQRPLLMFDDSQVGPALGAAAGARLSITNEPGESLDQIRDKEQRLTALGRDSGPLGRYRTAADLWCSAWLAGAGVTSGGSRQFAALLDELIRRTAVLPARVSAPLLAAARAAAARERFFHWTLEFPEVFYDASGQPLDAAGFDAVVGNPPWEILRGRRGDGLQEFVRASGIYVLQGRGHLNLFSLFVERALALVRPGGRYGFILPSSFASDHGCAALRRHVLDRTAVETFVTLDNREQLFPIHRSLRFLLLGGTTGGATPSIPCRFGVTSPAALEAPDDDPDDRSIVFVRRSLVARLSGDQDAIPELPTPLDVELVSRLVHAIPALGDPDGWRLSFGRELNATDDRHHFAQRPVGGRLARRRNWYPVVEGKQIQPFAVDLGASRFVIAASAAAALLDAERSYGHPRLAYRDVASASNRLTLIAAIIPPWAVTTHTLYCVKRRLDAAMLRFLCAVFNSYVANYLVRTRVNMHVTTAIVDRLPVPVAAPASAEFRRVGDVARVVLSSRGGRGAALLQARVAHLYRLSADEFGHVLRTLPLVPAVERDRAMAAYRADR